MTNLQSGIYIIKCLANNKVYVGSSKKMDQRKYRHFNNLKNNKHPNSHLQNAFNKYGIEQFEFHKIDFVEDELKLFEIEALWMDIFLSYNRHYGFNTQRVNPKGGHIRTQEIKNKIKSSIKKRHKTNPELFQNITRPLDVYKIGSNKYRQFNSIQEVANYFNLNRSRVESKINRIAHKDFIIVDKGNSPLPVYLHTLKVNSGYFINHNAFYGYNPETQEVKRFFSKKQFKSYTGKKITHSIDKVTKQSRCCGWLLAKSKEELQLKVDQYQDSIKPVKVLSYLYAVEEPTKSVMFESVQDILNTYPEMKYSGVWKCVSGLRVKHKGYQINRIQTRFERSSRAKVV